MHGDGNSVFYARVVWCWEVNRVDELFIPAASFMDAMEQIDAYYKNDLVSVKLYPFDFSVVNVAYIQEWLAEARKI